MARDVNALALSLLFSYVGRRRPGSLPRLVDGLPYTPAQLRSAMTWIDWATYAEIHRRVRALFPDEPGIFVEAGRASIDLDAFGFVRTMSLLLFDVRSIYGLLRRTVPQFLFPCVTIELRELGDDEIEMVYRLADGLEPVPGFFEIVQGILEIVPAVVGQKPATVVMSRPEGSGEARYRIPAPAAGGLLRRARAVLWNYLRHYPRAVQQLEDTNRRLQEQYDSLQKAYDEIDRYRARLEAMVDERTTQLSQANRALEQSVAQLQDLDRARSEFFANVSHELRTPLTMILGPVSTMLEGDAGPLHDAQREMLRIVSDHSRRLLRQVNNLLDVAKLEAGKMRLRFQPVDLVELVRGLVASVRGTAAARGLRVDLEAPPALAEVHVDPEQIEKVFLNLLGNALKFTPAGGRITTRIDDTAGFVRVAVEDTGEGIPPEHQQRVFERFTQVDGSSTRRHGGTGIGLALAHQIVALHAGHIDLESEVGKGSTFTVWLPKGTGHMTPEVTDRRTQDIDVPVKRRATDKEFQRVEEVLSDARSVHYADVAGAAAEDGAPPPLPAEEAAADPNLPLALVVDDDDDIRRYLAFALRNRFRVTEARNGLEGLEAARRLSPDVVLSDVMMPGIDGIELTRRLRVDTGPSRTPVVLLTARADPQSRIAGLEAVADDYLVKPFAARELVARLQNVVRLRAFERDLARKNDELQAALAELRRAESELVQKAKMASLGQLVAGVAHELNNPVNFMCGATQAIQEKLAVLRADAPPSKDALAQVSRLALVARTGGERVAGIVTALRQFYGAGPRARAPVDLEQGLRLTLLLLEPAIRDAGVAVEVDFPGPLTVEGNAGELNQVFMNLLTNAFQAAPGGTVRVSGERRDGEVSVAVRDTGPGVPDEIRSRIFEPFFTTREPGQGTGLGLAICDSIVRAHGGRILVESPPGQGATFRLVLPALGAGGKVP